MSNRVTTVEFSGILDQVFGGETCIGYSSGIRELRDHLVFGDFVSLFIDELVQLIFGESENVNNFVEGGGERGLES